MILKFFTVSECRRQLAHHFFLTICKLIRVLPVHSRKAVIPQRIDLAIRQGYLQKLREEFTQLKEKTDGHKTENL